MMKSFKCYVLNTCSQISVGVYILACAFGIGSWVAINGLFVELAIVVPHLPESWSLPSYLIVVIQIANIAPVLYVLGNKFFPKVIRENSVIYLTLIVGVIACGLLGFFWKETTFVAGSKHSTAFLVLAFFLAMADTTSSVSFIPFMSVFPEVYLSPYFVGEGLSGLLPSLVAIIQGVGKGASHSQCGVEPSNGTSNSTWSGGPQPAFSPNVFFFFLCGMMTISTLAFVGLNHLPLAKRQYVKHSSYDLYNQTPNKLRPKIQNGDEINGPERYELGFWIPGRDEGEINEKRNGNVRNECSARMTAVETTINRTNNKKQSDSQANKLTGCVVIYLLIILGAVNGLSNGIVPALMSYACIPYSYYVYHLTLTLSSIINPVVCFLFVLIRTRSPQIIAFLSVIYLAMCVYIITIAKQSPNVFLRCENAGSILIVLISVSSVALVTFIKVAIYALFRKKGRQALVWCGVVTQLGSFLGAVSIFAPVNVFHHFKQF